ncbi:MAG: hypothetical protein ACLFUA_05665 [Spirochaetales bacterium]
MYAIESNALTVTILDPVVDRDRMGVRYCTGGYIFQINDPDGPLLSGPTYPESFNWFDGQGIPDSFFLRPLRDSNDPGAEALIPGVGVCDTAAPSVLEFCDWQVDAKLDRVEFFAEHEWGGYRFTLERTVSVAGRVVRSETRIANAGELQFPICWFPHPFYPLPACDDLCSLPAPVTVPDGTTYTVGPTGYLRCADLGARQAVPVACSAAGPFAVLYRHPRVGLVAARYDYSASHVLVWGNPNTFSFEPYLERTVGVGMSASWSAEYHF